MKKPEWMTDHEWETKLREAQQQLEYDSYNAPEYIKRIARVGATAIVALILVLMIGALIKGIATLFGG